MSDQELIDFFIRNRDLFHNNSIISSAFRWIEWGVCKILIILADVCKNVYDTAFGLIDFTANDTINDFIDTFKPLLVMLLALSLLAMGISLILGNEKRPKAVQNALIMIICICCSTVVFSEMNRMTVSFKNAVEEIPVSDEKADGVYDIVSEHLYDIYYYDQKLSGGMQSIDFSKKKTLPHRNINEELIGVIDYNEVLDWDDEIYSFKSGAAEDILSHKLLAAVDASSTYILGEVNTGALWTNIGNEYYYRYQIDFFPLFCQLASLIVIYLAFGYRVVRILFELVFARLLGSLYSAEISGGEKIRKILIFIRDSYILLILTTLCIKFFFLLTSMVSTQVENTWVQGLLILFIAFCVADGPALIQQLLGMDAGLSGGIGKTLALMRVANGVSSRAGSLMRHSSSLLRGIGGGKGTAADKNSVGSIHGANSMGQSTAFMNDSSQSERSGSSFTSSSQSERNGSSFASSSQSERNGAGENAYGKNASGSSAETSSIQQADRAGGGESRNPEREQVSQMQDTGFMDERSDPLHPNDGGAGSPSSFMDEQSPNEKGHSFMESDSNVADMPVPGEMQNGQTANAAKDIMQDAADHAQSRQPSAKESEKEKSTLFGKTTEKTSERRMRDADDHRWNFMHDRETNPERRSSFVSGRKDDSNLTLKKKGKGRKKQ